MLGLARVGVSFGRVPGMRGAVGVLVGAVMWPDSLGGVVRRRGRRRGTTLIFVGVGPLGALAVAPSFLVCLLLLVFLSCVPGIIP